MDFGAASDINNFFYAGMVDLDTQIQSEVLQAITQPKRSMFYFRDAGAGIPEYENTPITAQSRIMMAYDVVMAIAGRNAQVPNGSTGGVDRRVAVSQNSVTIEVKDDEVTLNVLYIPLHSLQSRKIPAVPLGGRVR